ncbi:serine hydrolase domain-containing protein [Acidobacteriota bacterium]
MNKTICLSCLIGLLVISSQALPTSEFEQIEEQIKQKISTGVIPSLVVAVAKNGNIIFEKAYGWADIENKVLATTTTSYQLASVSKPLTATGVMVLHERKKVNIDSAVETYIEPLKFKVYEGIGVEVKLKHLLNHSSGLGTYFDIKYEDENIDQRDFEDTFKKYAFLVRPVGDVCEYSNLGYGLLDYVISKRSGKSFSAFMEQEVFVPLGMENSFVEKSGRSNFVVAKKYDSNLKVLPEMRNDTPGAGNIYASIHDLILFGMFNLKDDVPGQIKILKDETIDLMHSYKNENTFYPYYESAYYGYGWYFKENDRGYKNIWHEGGAMGMSSIIELVPSEDIAVAVMTNTSNNLVCQKIAHDIIKQLLPEYNPFSHSEVANFKPVAAAPSYSGVWRGSVIVDGLKIPISLNFQPGGEVIVEYTDYTFKSYFTQNNPIPHKSILLSAIAKHDYFLGMFTGIFPAKDIRREFSHFMSLKLQKKGDRLSGTVVAMAAAEREYYAYPFYIELQKQK